MAQYSADSLLTRIDDTPSIVPKRELVSTERIEVKKRNPEPVRVPEKQNDQLKYDRKIDSNRKDQVISRDIHTAPIRSLNDFLFDATWNVPRYVDDARIQNRIIKILKLLNQEKDRIMKNIDERGCITQEEADFLNQQTENALEETLNKFKQQAIQQLKIQSEDTKEEVHFKISFSNHLLKWLPDLFQ
ncbi:unnamed protein product [Rotaria sordida]|uniref:Uncharacterized protein n=1 Tax=Rotaria sordida TaxID=392033 RepID=A0A818U712_9BILA|nr:unnamed protein product [Rotaria sordida]